MEQLNKCGELYAILPCICNSFFLPMEIQCLTCWDYAVQRVSNLWGHFFDSMFLFFMTLCAFLRQKFLVLDFLCMNDNLIT